MDGITANRERCADYVKNSIGVVTALNPIIGYKNSTKIAKRLSLRAAASMIWCSSTVFSRRRSLTRFSSLENMIRPVKLNIKPRK